MWANIFFRNVGLKSVGVRKKIIGVALTCSCSFLLVFSVSRASAKTNTPPDLIQWLEKHPNVAESLRWESELGVRKWGQWSKAERQELIDAFERAWRHDRIAESWSLPMILPNQLTLKDSDIALTLYEKTLARKFYLNSVAHSFYLELSHQVPWSIANDSEPTLSVLFDSRHFFDWDSVREGYLLNEERNGYVSPAPAQPVFLFLDERNIIGRTRKGTIENFLRWASHLTHDFSTKEASHRGITRETTQYTDWFWHFRGYPPVWQVLQGTRQTMAPLASVQFEHWTAGCWGTAGLLKAVLRAANISVEVRSVKGHALPFFLSEDVFLTHGDDPYNGFFASLPSPRPVKRILFSGKQYWNVWFQGTKEAAFGRVGYGAALAGSTLLSPFVMENYCRDRKSGKPFIEGELYHELARHFSDQQIRSMKLEERLANRAASMGCAFDHPLSHFN